MPDPAPDFVSDFALPRRGRQVQLRAWEADDVDTYRYWQQPHHAWHRTDGPYFERPTTEQADRQAEIMHRFVAAGQVTLNDHRLVVADLDGAYLGTVSKYAVDRTGWTAIGVGIHDEKNWGRGVGRAAFALWVDLLFESLSDLHRLDARTWSGHHAMMRVAEHVGFTLEARFREARVVDGVRHDALGYGLLRSEWSTRRGEVR